VSGCICVRYCSCISYGFEIKFFLSLYLVRSALSQYRLKFYRISGGTLDIAAIWMILLLYRRNRSVIVYDLHWVSIEIEGLKEDLSFFWIDNLKEPIRSINLK
jgi:hypothetical protein